MLRPTFGSAAEAEVSIHGVSAARAGRESGIDVGDGRQFGVRGRGGPHTVPLSATTLAPLPVSPHLPGRQTRHRHASCFPVPQFV